MSSEKFNPENESAEQEAPKKRGPKPKKAAGKSDVQDNKWEIAKKRRMKTRERQEKTGALQGQKLIAPKKEGFVRRFVNESDLRIESLRDKGWDFAQDSDRERHLIASEDEGTVKRLTVGTQADGAAQRAVLMEIPEQWYLEDQAKKEALIVDTENSVRDASIGGDKGIGNEKGRIYTPENSNYQLE